MDLTMGKMINQKRIERRLTLRKFANQLGKSPTSISLIESDMQIPTQNMINKISELLSFNDKDIEFFNQLVLQAKNVHSISKEASVELCGSSPVIIALRTSKKLAEKDEEWASFVGYLN